MNKEIEKKFDEKFVRQTGTSFESWKGEWDEVKCSPNDIKSFIDTHFIARKGLEEAIQKCEEQPDGVIDVGGHVFSDCEECIRKNKALQALKEKLL